MTTPHTVTEGVCIVRVHGNGPRCGQIDIVPAVLISADECERHADYCARLYEAGFRTAGARVGEGRQQ